MADNSIISQAISEGAVEDANTSVSQAITEGAVADANTRISQAVSEAGVGDANTRISQAISELAAGNANTRISQLTIELGRGPEVVPPADSPSSTFVFDEGLGTTWYIVPQLTDSGVEMRDEVVKSVSVRGKVTNASFGVFGYGAIDDVDVEAIEAGNINSLTGVRVLPDTNLVQRSKRYPVNAHNIANHTIRVQGMWNGTGMRDRIDEIVYEVAIQGVRR